MKYPSSERQPTYEELVVENAELRQRHVAETAALRQQVADLTAQLAAALDRLRAAEAEIAELKRRGPGGAAPFSKGKGNPEGWVAEKATEPWTEADPPIFGLATGDFVYDPALRDHLFLAVVSRPLDGASLDAWLSGFLTAEGCTLTGGDAIDGADRVLRSECDIALASSGGRGYFIALYASGDDVELRTLDTAALFEALLATVQFHPEDAVAE